MKILAAIKIVVQRRHVSAQHIAGAIGGVVIYRAMHTNRGPMEVCIDDDCQTVVNYADVQQWQQPWMQLAPQAGVHTVTIRSVTSRSDLDAVQVLGAMTPLAVDSYEETNANLTYIGSWTPYSGSEPSGGSIHYTSQQNAAIGFLFDGVGVALYRTLNSNRGPMEVCIDGNCQTVESYAASTVWQQPWTQNGLAVGVHTLTIRNLYTNTSHPVIDLDAIEVLAPSPDHNWHYQYDNLSRVTLACSDGWDDVAYIYVPEQLLPWQKEWLTSEMPYLLNGSIPKWTMVK